MSCTVKDVECCKVISSSITEIIRRSLNEAFREKCFQILETSNTNGVENEVNSLFLEITTTKRWRKMRKGLSKRDTFQAAASSERSHSFNLAAKDLNDLATERTKLDDCLVPDDVNLEEIDNWD